MQNSILMLASQTASPQTGDSANVMLYVIFAIIAVVLVLILTFKDKIFKPKDQKNDEKKAAGEEVSETAESAKKTDVDAANSTEGKEEP